MRSLRYFLPLLRIFPPPNLPYGVTRCSRRYLSSTVSPNRTNYNENTTKYQSFYAIHPSSCDANDALSLSANQKPGFTRWVMTSFFSLESRPITSQNSLAGGDVIFLSRVSANQKPGFTRSGITSFFSVIIRYNVILINRKYV